MKENFTNSYSGIIDIADFSTEVPNKSRINKYQDANNLRSKCESLKKFQENKEKIMKYSLEELREMNLISNTNGRPSSTLTDEKWQKEFEIYRYLTVPTDKQRFGGKHSRELGIRSESAITEYKGATNWQQYCAFINDVLDSLRSGLHDYCYYIYQIQDLLKFYPNMLCSKYCDGYWEVWLDA